MPDPALPPSLAADLADLRRRLSSLESSPKAPFTSINAGALTVLDDSGVIRVIVGQLSTPGKYGVQVIDTSGGTPFKVDQDGMHTPYLATPFFDPAASKPVTSGSFVEVYRARVELITEVGCYVWVQASGDASTTGEIRIRTGANTTNAVSVFAGAFVLQQFRWLHGQTLQSGPVDFSIEARRTSGAGNVNVYLNSGLSLTSPTLCTATGL